MKLKSGIPGDILIKSRDKTDPAYGCIPEKRPIDLYIANGIINLDKPSGPTSHQVVTWVRDMLKLEKAGHSGTLDPRVTGVLPIALGDSTKILRPLLTAGKEYVAVMCLHGDAPLDRVKETLNYFQGPVYQKPPLKSAVKRDLRIRRIYYINFIENSGRAVLFRVGCAAGTYIRKLCCDIGMILGTGANMQELRRTRVGSFDETDLVTLHDLKDAYEFYLEDQDESHLRKCVQPMENGVKHLKKIWIKDTAIGAVCHGASLNAPGVSRLESGIVKGELVAIFSLKNEIVAIARCLKTSGEIHRVRRGAVAELRRVIMDNDVYPKGWGHVQQSEDADLEL